MAALRHFISLRTMMGPCTAAMETAEVVRTLSPLLSPKRPPVWAGNLAFARDLGHFDMYNGSCVQC